MMATNINQARFLPIVFGLAMVVLLVSIASAAVWTDREDYQPGSVVTISGDNSDDAGYLQGETVLVDVQGPNGYTATCSAVADEQGAWSCQVTLWEDESAVGEYTYTAVGQISAMNETGSFTDGLRYCYTRSYDEYVLTTPEPYEGLIGEFANVAARVQRRTRNEVYAQWCSFWGCDPCYRYSTWYSSWNGIPGQTVAFNLGPETGSAVTSSQGWASTYLLVSSDSTLLSAAWNGYLKEMQFTPVSGSIADNTPSSLLCDAMWQEPEGRMVGYWTFDNSADLGIDVFDLQNGELYGGPILIVGKSGGALDLDGINDFVDLGTSKTLTDWPTYSLSIWFRHMNRGDIGTRGYGQKIISKATYFRDFHLQIKTNDGHEGWLNVWTHYNPSSPGGSGTSLSLVDYRNFIDETWHHAVITKNGDWGELWVDGEMVDSEPIHSPDTVSLKLYLGYTPHTDHYQQRYFGGSIDEFAIFDRVLSPDEIQRLYSRGNSGRNACFNYPPAAVDDAYTINEDQVLNTAAAVGVLTNDTDIDNHSLNAALVSSVSHGTLIFNEDGSFNYTPSSDYFGTDSFSYRASDGIVESNIATALIEVVPVNDAPLFIIGPDQVILEDAGPQFVSSWATGMSAGSANESGQLLAFVVTNDNNALFSTQPTVAPDGSLSYESAPDAYGTAQIAVQLQDDGGTAYGGIDTSSEQIATITVQQDTDGDGWINDEDNAPLNYNPDQSDIDLDGIADVIDDCPNDAGNNCDPGGSAATYVDPSEEEAISTPDDTVSITIPAGAMTEGSSVSITDTDGNSEFNLTTNRGKVVGVFSISLQPPLTFNEPVAITFAWDDADNDGFVDGTNANEENLIVVKDGTVITGKCKNEPADGVPPDCDTDANTFTFEMTSWSEFALAWAGDPVVTNIEVPPAPVAINGQPISVTGSFTDADDDDLHEAQWDWGDGTLLAAGDVNQGDNTVSGSHTYAETGIYRVTLTVVDTYPNSGSLISGFVVIYDPEDGFVTGGGWIDSPEGAYMPEPMMTGKATFGFISKYKKGATVPTGNTEFQFRTADLNFHADSYEYLVITGEGSNYAKFKGIGTINGEGEYKFMIWAGDDDPDTFRIKIWTEDEFGNETVAYDNGFDQAIGGGSITIHAK